ncbi:MAG: carboxypeptidase regulatory-like domain-containing protein [Acidobacteria bacterium]|nr:carboxypeptidase regulatory-like domain-containing protein [Acidobacteriota bacterium]
MNLANSRPWYQPLSLLLSALLCCALPGQAAELVGLARASGPAQVNNLRLPQEANVYSGDLLTTGSEGRLTLFCGSQRVRLAPHSKVELRQKDSATSVVLQTGAVAFSTHGPGRLSIEAGGLSIQGRSGSAAVGEVALSPRGPQLVVLDGIVEVVHGNQTIAVAPGQSALFLLAPEADAAEAAPQAQPSTVGQMGAVSGRLVDAKGAAMSGAQVLLISTEGTTFTTQTDLEGTFRFEGVPPGRYRLRASKAGLGTVEIRQVTVVAGQESLLGAVTFAGAAVAGGVSKGALVAILAAAGGAAGAAAAFAGGGEEQQPTSPSGVP